jgi:elongation factor P
MSKGAGLGRRMPPGHLLNKWPFVVRSDCRGKREGLSYLGLHELKDMANTSDIKNGMVLNHNNGLWQIVEFLHVKPGKGAAFVRTKLKNIETGKVVDNTFNAGHKIDPVRIETREHTFLYNDDEGYHFMNAETYEQIRLDKHLISAPQFLKDGLNCLVVFHADEERPINCDLPSHVELEITYTEPGVKGDTATNSLKPATVDTGAEVRVPLFINNGDWIKVDTRSGDYTERIKK